jgi:hypothetical protein
MMFVEEAYQLGETVYLKTDTEQLARIVTGLMIRPTGIMYYISCELDETTHYDIELSRQKNIMITTNN